MLINQPYGLPRSSNEYQIVFVTHFAKLEALREKSIAWMNLSYQITIRMIE